MVYTLSTVHMHDDRPWRCAPMMLGWDYTNADSWLVLAGVAIIAMAVLASIWLVVRRP